MRCRVSTCNNGFFELETTMKKFAFFVLAVLMLSGCANIERPQNDQTGADQMKISPCVCREIDFNSRGYQWHS